MSNILITKAFCSTAVGSAKFVLLTLCDAANQDAECWLGLDTLRVKTGLSRTAIKSAVSKLELDGHISVKRRYNKTNIYQIHPVESKVAKELLYDRPSLEKRETLLDQVFDEISQKKKALANGEILMGRNPTHHDEELMGRNPTLNGPESDPPMGRNPTHNPKGTIREPKEGESGDSLPPHADEEIKKPSKAKSKETNLADYLAQCQAEGKPGLSEDHYIWDRAKKIGLTENLVHLEWCVFKEKYLALPNKKYADWGRAFANCVQAGWHGLYKKSQDGNVFLTTAGKNAMAIYGDDQ